MKWTIPTLMFTGGVIAAMYFGGLGYAEIKTTYLESPLIETTDLDSISNAPFYSFQFYCNATAMSRAIQLNANIPLAPNASAVFYTPTTVELTGTPIKGCQKFANTVL